MKANEPATRGPGELLAIAWLLLVAVLAIAAPWIAPFDPLDIDLNSMKQMPSPAHWLGTDALGRDVLSRLLFGALPTLVGVVQATCVAAVLGAGLGVCAGYFGGRTDRAIGQLVDTLQSLPSIVILLAILALFDRSMPAAMVTLGVLGSAGVIRVMRSSTLGVRGELYIAAARITGLGDATILMRHVLPRVRGPLIVQVSLFSAVAVIMQTGISFLGLGPAPPAPSWGAMIYEASVSLNDFPWLLVPSGGVVALTILAFGLMGDALRDSARRGSKSDDPDRSSRRLVADTAPPVEAGSPCGASVLCVRGLTIAAGSRILVEDLSFDLSPAETLGLVGESGSGKTLTVLALMGLLPAGIHTLRGCMMLWGARIDLADKAALARLRGNTLGMIFQEPLAALDPCFTVGHHLTEVIRRHRKVSRRTAREQAIELLRMMQIFDPDAVANLYPHQLSGGMAQRVGIARALAPGPCVLFADEPTTALDVTVQAEILELLRTLCKDKRMAVVFVTHDWGVVADICDRAMVMLHGRVLETAPVLDIFDRPRHPYTRALLRANPHDATPGQPLPTVQETLASLGETWP